jgi:N-acetyl-D-muramate 6-phosphate phosphatase
LSAPVFPDLVLFDLDGTLLDSAPDFVATINRLRDDRALAPIGLDALRPHVSRGARAMLAATMPDEHAAAVDGLVAEFLAVYQAELGRHGGLFDGIEALLNAIEADGCRWGIVTNKPEYLARQLLPVLGWQAHCAVLVGGDTLPVRKPDPLPLLHAARSLGVDPSRCVYVGDDQRDIEAARAAGMPSIVALWGYRLDGDDPYAWGGDAHIASPALLLDHGNWPRA